MVIVLAYCLIGVVVLFGVLNIAYRSAWSTLALRFGSGNNADGEIFLGASGRIGNSLHEGTLNLLIGNAGFRLQKAGFALPGRRNIFIPWTDIDFLEQRPLEQRTATRQPEQKVRPAKRLTDSAPTNLRPSSRRIETETEVAQRFNFEVVVHLQQSRVVLRLYDNAGRHLAQAYHSLHGADVVLLV